jgi:hypothetical protein
MFVGSFAAQWGIGIVADGTRAWLATNTAGGLRVAFASVLAIDTLAYAWFAFGWRRHANVSSLARAAA